MDVVVMRPERTTSASEVNAVLLIWRRSGGLLRYMPNNSIVVSTVADIEPDPDVCGIAEVIPASLEQNEGWN